MNQRENILRAVRFDYPEYIPMAFHINSACWQYYPQDALQELMANHPLLFPKYIPTTEKVRLNYSPVQLKDKPYTDPWGCVWETMVDGITGTVTKHPISDWSDFESYKAPDPEQTDGLIFLNWYQVEREMNQEKEQGALKQAGLRHGHTFMQLCDIRGYESLLFDMADSDPRLWRLIKMVEEFNLTLVEKYVDLGAEWISYPEDLGMQHGPMLSPQNFRKYIRPSYEQLMVPAIEAGCIVHMHSDGDIRVLVDDLIGSGVQVINLQDLVNGIDWIADQFAGRICVDLDIDRQKITPYGSPDDVDRLVREEVEKLGCKEGGLMMIYGLYPGIPLENIKALMGAMEKYATYYME